MQFEDIDLTAWIGRTETAADTVTPTPVARLTATLDHPAAPVPAGTPLPPLWHWLYFLPMHRQSEIGAGRPRQARRLPAAGAAAAPDVGRQPVRVPQRRSGSATRSRARRRSTTSRARRAAPGQLVFVKVRHEVRCNGAADPALVEFHDIVYRGRAQPGRGRAAAHAGADRSAMAARDRARRRAAVPLLGADLQRPPHPLRPPLRHRGRGLPGPDRARPADRHAAAGPAAPQRCPTPRWRRSGSGRCARPSTCTRSGSTASRGADGKTVQLWAQDHEGWLTMDATATLR